jgi:hypothetical protein
MSIPSIMRIAAGVALLQYVAHAALFLLAKPSHGAEEVAVVAAMKEHRFRFGGFDRSYWDFYVGYGLIAILFGVLELAFLLQASSIARTDPARASLMALVLLVANVGHALVAWRFFFLAPFVGDVAVSACLVWALVAHWLRSSSAQF